MQSKHIILAALIQTGVLVFSILLTGAVRRAALHMVGENHEGMDFFVRTAFFRDYGFLLFGLVLAWTIGASYYSFYPSARSVPSSWLSGSGVALIFGFVVLGIWMVSMAGTPFWCAMTLES